MGQFRGEEGRSIMHQAGRQMLCCILLASVASAQAPDEETSRFESQVEIFGDTMCALKVLSKLPLITVQTSSLALDQIATRQGPHMQFYVVTVPLRKPAGKVEAVAWETRSLTDAVMFIRLLQHKKLNALKVEPRLASIHGEPLSDGQREACRGMTRESEEFTKLAERLQECTTCRIKELMFSPNKLKE